MTTYVYATASPTISVHVSDSECLYETIFLPCSPVINYASHLHFSCLDRYNLRRHGDRGTCYPTLDQFDVVLRNRGTDVDGWRAILKKTSRASTHIQFRTLFNSGAAVTGNADEMLVEARTSTSNTTGMDACSSTWAPASTPGAPKQSSSRPAPRDKLERPFESCRMVPR